MGNPPGSTALDYFQALLLLDAVVYPALQAVGTANVAQTEGVVSYIKTMKKSKQCVHHFAFK